MELEMPRSVTRAVLGVHAGVDELVEDRDDRVVAPASHLRVVYVLPDVSGYRRSSGGHREGRIAIYGNGADIVAGRWKVASSLLCMPGLYSQRYSSLGLHLGQSPPLRGNTPEFHLSAPTIPPDSYTPQSPITPPPWP